MLSKFIRDLFTVEHPRPNPRRPNPIYDRGQIPMFVWGSSHATEFHHFHRALEVAILQNEDWFPLKFLLPQIDSRGGRIIDSREIGKIVDTINQFLGSSQLHVIFLGSNNLRPGQPWRDGCRPLCRSQLPENTNLEPCRKRGRNKCRPIRKPQSPETVRDIFKTLTDIAKVTPKLHLVIVSLIPDCEHDGHYKANFQKLNHYLCDICNASRTRLSFLNISGELSQGGEILTGFYDFLGDRDLAKRRRVAELMGHPYNPTHLGKDLHLNYAGIKRVIDSLFRLLHNGIGNVSWDT